MFTQLKLIKGEKRSCLGEDRFDDLLQIDVVAPHLSQWDSSGAVKLWWRDKTRRVTVQDTRAHPIPKPKQACSAEDTETDKEPPFSLTDWETWLEPSD